MSLLQRSWRALRIYSRSCERPQLRLHYPRRLLSTAVVGNRPPSNVFALALGSALFGLGGYYIGTRLNTLLVPTHTTVFAPPKPVYGTPEDFARAIEELKTLFTEDAVTTAENQLKAHGFSSNTHLPGTPGRAQYRLGRIGRLTLGGCLCRLFT